MEASDAVHAYIQRSQVAVGVCATEDYVSQVSAIWTLLDAFPKTAKGNDLLAAAIAVCRVAIGFFEPGAGDRMPLRTKPMSDRKTSRDRVNVLLHLIKQSYFRADLSLGQLAARMGLSVEYLSRALAAQTGHAFRTHLNGIRLLAALVRLHADSCSLKMIAQDVGYPDTGELDRQFSRRFHHTPREFRHLLRLLPDRLRR